MRSSVNATPEGTSLGGNTSCDVQIVKIHPCGRPDSFKKKVKQVSKNGNKHVTCRVFSLTTHVVTVPYGLSYVYTCNHFKFQRNPFRGLRATLGQLSFPLLWLLAFTTACIIIQNMIYSVDYFGLFHFIDCVFGYNLSMLNDDLCFDLWAMNVKSKKSVHPAANLLQLQERA